MLVFVCGKQRLSLSNKIEQVAPSIFFLRLLSKLAARVKQHSCLSNIMISDRCHTKIIEPSTVLLSFSYFKQELRGSCKRNPVQDESATPNVNASGEFLEVCSATIYT